MSDASHRPATSTVDHGITRDGLVQLRRQWAADRPVAAMLLLHGIAEHSGRYEHVGAAFARAGIATVAIDHRGFGGSGGSRAYVRAFREYLDDVDDQLAEVRRLGLPVVLFGHSMGGLVALSYVLEDRPPPDLLVLTAPALDADVPAVLRALVPAAAVLMPRVVIPSPIRGDMLATDPAVGAAYFADDLVVTGTTGSLARALFAQMRWAGRHLSALSVPTLVLHGRDDRLVPPRVSAPLGELPGAERRDLPGLRHEILNEPGRDQIVADIVAWIRLHLDARVAGARAQLS